MSETQSTGRPHCASAAEIFARRREQRLQAIGAPRERAASDAPRFSTADEIFARRKSEAGHA